MTHTAIIYDPPPADALARLLRMTEEEFLEALRQRAKAKREEKREKEAG